MRSEDQKYTTISIPVQLASKVKETLEGTGFHSLSSFTTYVLRQIVSEKGEKGFDSETEKKIKSRLKALGYIE